VLSQHQGPKLRIGVRANLPLHLHHEQYTSTCHRSTKIPWQTAT
jgi:hypothetical protein